MIRVAAFFLAACGNSTCPRDLPESCPVPVPSYKSAVGPIIQKDCLPCHNPTGEAAGQPLSQWADIEPIHGAILDQVYDCNMPHPPYELTIPERVTLLGWLVCEAPDN